MKLSDAVQGFLIARAAEGYSPHTLTTYKLRLSQLATHAGDPDIARMDSGQINAFLTWLRTEYVPQRMNGDKSPLGMSSVHDAWCAIRSLFNWASQEFEGIQRPDDRIQAPQFKHPEIRPLDNEEIKRLLVAAEYSRPSKPANRQGFQQRNPGRLRDKALILLLLDTGLRASEVSRLNIEDVDLESGEVYVRPWGSGRKTKSRHVYLGKSARKALWRFLADRKPHPDDPLFESQQGRRLDRNAIRLILNRISERAGVPGVHPHRFRHTFAIQYLRNGGDVFSLQRILGHSTLDMVQNYLHIAEADIETAHRKASPADNWRL